MNPLSQISGQFLGMATSALSSYNQWNAQNQMTASQLEEQALLDDFMFQQNLIAANQEREEYEKNQNLFLTTLGVLILLVIIFIAIKK